MFKISVLNSKSSKQVQVFNGETTSNTIAEQVFNTLVSTISTLRSTMQSAYHTVINVTDPEGKQVWNHDFPADFEQQSPTDPVAISKLTTKGNGIYL